jgi:protein-tyrosine phosphatase
MLTVPLERDRSGPSQTYPQLAYRNPLDQLVSYLDRKHGDDWAIWEFRAEGTGYPDEAVHGRVRHYPWPDHHPPPFRLMPMIVASMKNWLEGGDLHGETAATTTTTTTTATEGNPAIENAREAKEARAKNRVVVVHCKAGKGRSGTVSCSYLIAEEGWTPVDALARFTQRRMRPQFGAGVSIPSQLRWVNYVERWAKAGRRYVDRPIEIVEIHVWGMCHGVKFSVEGFEDEGKRIRTFHTFTKAERMVVEGDAPDGGGLSDMMWELAGYSVAAKEEAPQEADLAEGANNEVGPTDGKEKETGDGAEKRQDSSNGGNGDGVAKKASVKRKGTNLIKAASINSAHVIEKTKEKRKSTKSKSKTFNDADTASGKKSLDGRSSSSSSSSSSASDSEAEPGGMAVILKPAQPIRIPNSDINISAERRSRSRKSMGLTMVTAVAHVWFNAFFEGNGDEDEDGSAPLKESGVFSIKWDAMDGIKGTSRKGARAFDRIAVVWRVAGGKTGEGEEVKVPMDGTPVPQAQAADWSGPAGDFAKERTLGLRTQSPPNNADANAERSGRSEGIDGQLEVDDGASLEGVKSSGPTGGNLSDSDAGREGKEQQSDKK